ncbi:MAG: hypothetical protein KDE27_12060 [Planctomycetes bacterium]|nr:hypothetical protein [Planctomycetota bacterium]
MPDAARQLGVGVALAALGAASAIAAAIGFVDAATWPVAIGAVLAHAAAVVLVALGTRRAGTSRSEVALFATLTATLPGLGACAALWFVVGGAPRHAANAHAENDTVRVERSRGETDLRRELGVNSYTQVVRAGSLEEKRNLLRRLARLGTPRHLSIVRQFLFEDEPELRLCAYAELARIGQRHEQEIGELRCAAQQADGVEVGPALAALAEANRAYAISGVLDSEMAGYWSERAEVIATRALDAEPGCAAAERVLALALADRGALEEAWQIICGWPEEFDEHAELVRAEVAFRRQGRGACRESLHRLEAAGVVAPEWLRTIAGRRATT